MSWIPQIPECGNSFTEDLYRMLKRPGTEGARMVIYGWICSISLCEEVRVELEHTTSLRCAEGVGLAVEVFRRARVTGTVHRTSAERAVVHRLPYSNVHGPFWSFSLGEKAG